MALYSKNECVPMREVRINLQGRKQRIHEYDVMLPKPFVFLLISVFGPDSTKGGGNTVVITYSQTESTNNASSVALLKKI